MTKRTDIHSPSNLSPENYAFVGWYYFGHDFEQASSINLREVREYLDTHEHVGAHGEGQCDHCGAYFLYGAIFEHVDGGYIRVGHSCSQGAMGITDRFELELFRMRKRVQNAKERAAVKKAYLEYLANNQEFANALEWANEQSKKRDSLEASARDAFSRAVAYNFNTIIDIAHRLERLGWVTEGQEQLVARLYAEGQEKLAGAEEEAERVGQLEPLEQGRYSVTGEVVGFKTYDNAYGSTLKVLVQLASGHKVFGTLPSSIDDAQRGDSVTFTASFEPKANDFATFSRPTKASLA